MARSTLVLIAMILAAPAGPAQEPAPSPAEVEACLARVKDYHGVAGPWAVVGYRMGQRALKETGKARGDHDLMIVHRSPAEVQFTCMADGLQAATGASAGKLNLKLEEAPPEGLRTVVTDRDTGKAIAFTPRRELALTIKDVPFERLEAEGRRIAALPDSALFEVVATTGR